MQYRLSVVLMAMLASGCTATYVQKDVALNPGKLVSNQAVSIATPADGRYEATIYKTSGVMTAGAVRAAFAQHSNKVTVYDSCADLVCIRKQGGTGYYVVPEILHWEERATEWSGLPDRIEIKLTVYGQEGEEPLASTIVSGKSKWATFGGDHPQDLLQQPIDAYVKTQY